MIYAELPPMKPRKLPFYLAMEEYLARNYPDGEFFFMWQVDPTVIYGRCQDPQAEVNLEFCRSHGIEVYRRKSGGGCVFADRNNIMFSYITTAKDDVPTTFGRYCSMVAGILRELGLEASASGRNDVLIGDRKVSGNAFYSLHDRVILHGTMLFDADLETMAQAITPSAEKLARNGVKSVPARVTTIRRHLPDLPLEEFKAFVRRRLCDSTRLMTPDDLTAIRALERPYYSPAWLSGRFPDSPDSC